MDQKAARAAIEIEYGSLPVDVTAGGRLCPMCNGGSKSEGSLSVTRSPSGLLYVCHRNSCGFSGLVQLAGRAALSKTVAKPQRADGRQRYQALRKGPLPSEVRAMLESKYGILPELQAHGLLRWTEDHSHSGRGRVVFPIRDRLGNPYGYVARKFDDQPGPKSLTMAEDVCGSWYLNHALDPDTILIVEDSLSALKASWFVNSVALLGTHASESTLKALKDGGYTNIFVALDADAFTSAIRMTAMMRPKFPGVRVLRLRKDIKDMQTNEVVELLLNNKVIKKDPRV